MPISISGSGVITGASSFASNTIFSGTVGVAGAVNTSSNLLVSGTANVTQGLTTANSGIASLSLPIGAVLQQYTTQLTAASISLTGGGSLVQITSSNSTEIQPFTITPVGTNSKFICQAICFIDASTNLYHEQTGLFVGSTLLGASWLYRRVSGTEPLLHHTLGTYTASGSGSFTLSYRAYAYGASPTLRFGLNASVNPTPGVATLMITEIKT